jgi:hypothetical protein
MPKRSRGGGKPGNTTDYREIMSRPTISPEQLHATGLLSISKNLIYDACNRGEIECVRFGRRIVIPTKPLMKKLGLDAV